MKQLIAVLLLLSVLVAINGQINAQIKLPIPDLIKVPAQNLVRVNDLRIAPTCPAWGCNWHWIFAIDQSGSMGVATSSGTTRWDKAKNLLNLFGGFLGSFGYHKMTVYTFDSRATLPPTKYLEYSDPNSWSSAVLPPTANGGTDFGQPLIRGIEFILLHRNINTCFVMITDGQAGYPSFEIQLFQLTKNYITNDLNKHFCVLCYFIKGDLSTIPAAYSRLCSSIGASGPIVQYRLISNPTSGQNIRAVEPASSGGVVAASADNFDNEIFSNFKSSYQRLVN